MPVPLTWKAPERGCARRVSRSSNNAKDAYEFPKAARHSKLLRLILGGHSRAPKRPDKDGIVDKTCSILSAFTFNFSAACPPKPNSRP